MADRRLFWLVPPLVFWAQVAWGADAKVSSLDLITPTGDDILYVVDDPGGTPVSKKATVSATVGAANALTATALAANGANCNAGEAPRGVDASGAAENCTDYATQIELDAHLNDASAAHAASAVSFSAAGNIASTDVQSAIEELDSEKLGTSGNAATASALAANGSNCSAGQFPLGVNAAGAAESCTALPTTITGTSNQITASGSTGAITLSIPTNPTLPGTTTGTFSGNITGTVTGNASTASALAANGANCSSGQAPLGVDAAGAVESCFDVATQVELDAHLNDTSAAHAASAIAFTPAGNLAADDVQEALEELDTEKFGTSQVLTSTNLPKADVLMAPLHCADAGANDTYACNLSPAITAYVTGTTYWFKANTANTGAATVNFNSVGAKTIKTDTSGITTDLNDNYIKAGRWVPVTYDGTNMQIGIGTGGSGSVSVPGSDTQVIFNDATALGADSGLTYNKTTDALTVAGPITVGPVGTNDLVVDTSAVTGHKTWTAPNVSGAIQVDGAVSINVETSGNTITTVSRMSIAAAGGSVAAPYLTGDTVAALAPTAACTAGVTNTSRIRCTADFPDSDGNFGQQWTGRLPADWTGAIDLQLKWRTATANSGLNVVWQASISCIADAETDDAAFNTPNTVTDAGKGTANQMNDAAITSMTTTGCSAGEQFVLYVFRNRTHASDTMTGVVSLSMVELTIRRAQ